MSAKSLHLEAGALRRNITLPRYLLQLKELALQLLVFSHHVSGCTRSSAGKRRAFRAQLASALLPPGFSVHFQLSHSLQCPEAFRWLLWYFSLCLLL